MAVEALADLILIVVENAREFFGGEASRQEVLCRDVCGEYEVPLFVFCEASSEGRRILKNAVVPALERAPILGVEVGRRSLTGAALGHRARHIKYGMLAAKVAPRYDIEAFVFQEPTDVLLP